MTIRNKHLSKDQFWDQLKRQCAATPESDPKWSEVKKITMVRQEDIAQVLKELEKQNEYDQYSEDVGND